MEVPPRVLPRDDHIGQPVAVGVLDVVGRAGGQVDRVAFGDGLFAIRGDEHALVFDDPEPEFHLVITPLDALMAGLDGLAVDECNGFQAPVFLGHRPELMPANRAFAVADRHRVFPVANHARAARGRVDVFAQDEVLEPIVIHVVEHLVVNVGRQIDRIPRPNGKPVFADEDFAAAAEDVIGLFDLRVLVVVRGLAALQSVFDHALKMVQLMCVFVCAFGGGVFVFQPRPANRAQVRDFRLLVSPISNVCHRRFLSRVVCQSR